MIEKSKILMVSFMVGIIPSLIWLWFWLKEENEKEPRKILIAMFIIGMLSVIFVLPIQQLIEQYILDENLRLILWALAEEIIKYLAFFVIIWHTKYIRKPIDYAIFIITASLGFAAAENTLFLIEPFSAGENIVALLTGGLRFLGSTLLHSVSSALIGISIGFAFYMNRFFKNIYLLFGIILATALHTLFNFFIIKNVASDFLKVFILLWVVTIIIMLLFEKLRRLSGEFN